MDEYGEPSDSSQSSKLDATETDRVSHEIELSVILPAFNEQEGVVNAIEQYDNSLIEAQISYEIIVIDDASSDRTLEEATAAAEGRPQVKLLHNLQNLGQVGSILRGFTESQGEIVLHNGIDLPLAPGETADIIERFHQGADVVVIERSNRGVYSLFRKLLSWVNITFVKLLLKSPVTDHNFSQAYRSNVFDKIEVETNGVSTVTTELIVKASKLGFRVESFLATYHRRESGQSSITLRKSFHSFLELLRLAIIMRRFPKRRHPQ